MSAPELRRLEVQYPETDGKPMAESDLHRDLMLYLIVAAEHHFRSEPEVYISGNLFVYFEEGNPQMVVAPDFFAVRGVPKRRRRIFRLWEEKKGPELVVEITSPSTHLEDLGNKRAIYERLAVKEYFLFDPEGGRFQPPMKGFRLQGETLEPEAATRKDDGTLVLTSDVFGLELHGHGESLRWVDPSTGAKLPNPDDLRKMVAAERNRAEAEKNRTEAERKRAEAAEAEVARLREALAEYRDKPDR